MNEVSIQYEEFDGWPLDETAERRDAPFKASWFKTKDLLDRELYHIGATEVRLKTAHGMGQRRRDGGPLSDRKPPHPGVILTFNRAVWNGENTEVVAMKFPCDTFSLWEDNLRAIALALEALRKVDRYGVNPGSQYTGFRALPPASNGSAPLTPEQAARFILDNCGIVIPSQPKELIENKDYANLLYKMAAKRLHPDKSEDAAEFQKLEESIRLLREL